MLKRRLGRPEALGEPVVFTPQRGPLDLKTRKGLLHCSRLLWATGRRGDHSGYRLAPRFPRVGEEPGTERGEECHYGSNDSDVHDAAVHR
jgi:hypothetical protein